ncbi:60S ribosomal protein L27-like [Hibiscus syriacus]|uniref:60S ribosomal protein L27-like n=1 Tax=Hibiscus syriacus TaxID=106335 RepID=A0A6A3CFU5_HIBSY|nr:60S ribosomal protein L27-like [Hibiscus syriacus]
MEMQYVHNLFERLPLLKSKAPAVKWFKRWVPQDVVATGGKCMVLKWVNVIDSVDTFKALERRGEHTLEALNEREKEQDALEPEPEPTTEVLFLCSYEGCGKTFIDAGALRKHSHIHGERQCVCHYEGCGKAFSLDFNLRSPMKTHSQENYHICPYRDCGKRYAHEYKLKNHIAQHHEKNPTPEVAKYVPPVEKIIKTPKSAGSAYGSASSDRPYACPYEENATPNADNEMDEGSDHDAYAGKRVNGKSQKQSRAKPNVKMPPAKIARQKGMSPSPATLPIPKKQWPVKQQIFEEEDSEETEEDRENVEDGWRYRESNEEDDEETEYED